MQPAEKMLNEYIQNYREELGEIPTGTVNFYGHEFPIDEFVARAIHRAASLRVDAGFSGAMNDGGSGALFHSLQAWICGIIHSAPPGRDFKSIAKQMVKEIDPEEYKEYLRLKTKYGD